MYYRPETQQIFTSHSTVRSEFPNVSFPSSISDTDLEGHGVYPIQSVAPEYDSATQEVTEGQPEQRDGLWYQTWEVRDLTAEEIAEHRKSMIPESVTMRQCRIALLDAGLLDAVKSSIVTMPGTDGERARIDWEYAQEVRRDWPLIGYMAGDLGLADEQVDSLFMAAAAI